MKQQWIMVLAGLNAILVSGTAWAAEWYAEVQTTGGNFTIQLDWERAPNGCAAFAALAEGLTDWVNPQSGKVEKGVEYYPGTAMSWVPMAGEKVALLGNRGRLFSGADGTPNVANGSGLTLKDDIRDGGGRGLAARSVAMMNSTWGPDTLDGQWAVMMENCDAIFGGKWSRIGTVASNWGVVESIAGGARDGATGLLKTPAAVTGVRIWSDPPKALEAWRAGATNWPACGQGEVALEVKGTNGTMRCGWPEKSQYAVVHCSNLMSVAKSVAWMDWHEEGEEELAEVSFFATQEPSGEGTVWFGQQHFCTVAEVRYPELTEPGLKGNGHDFITEYQWGDGSVETFLHELDWEAATGTVWKVTEAGERTYDSTVVGMGLWRAGANSVELVLGEWVPATGVVYYFCYRLGAEGTNGVGRFQLQATREVWGDWREEPAGEGSRKRKGKTIAMGEWRGKVAPPSRRRPGVNPPLHDGFQEDGKREVR